MTSIPRPTALDICTAGIPDALKAEPRWVLWRYELRKEDRWAKIPYQANRRRRAESDNPATWATFDGARGELCCLRDVPYDGLGFVLGDGWAGIDLDGVSAPLFGEVQSPIVKDIARTDAYCERSPSDTGYKTIGRCARIGGEVNFKTDPPSYTTWTGARFFAITGWAVGSVRAAGDLTDVIERWFPVAQQAPSEVPSYFKIGDTRGKENITAADVYRPLSDDEVVERILASPQADKFARLVRGDMSDYGQDHSRADQALVNILAYWCRSDVEQIDRLFRQTKLMRPKWDAPSYRRATLAKATRI